MALNYLKWLKDSAGEDIFKQVVKAAEDDIKLIVRYLDNEKVALKVLTNFNKVFDIICLHPNIGFTKEEFIYRDVRLFVFKKSS